MSDKIKIRRGLQADLPSLDEGEFGLALDSGRLYIGGTSGNILVGISTSAVDGYALDGYLSASRHAIPTLDNTYDIGSQDFRWRDGYFGPSSIHIVAKASELTATPVLRDWGLGIDTFGNFKISHNDDGYITISSDGQLLVIDGLTVTPSIAALSDPDTGIYFGGAGRVDITSGGTTQFRFDGNRLRGSNAAGPAMMNEATSATNPVFAMQGDEGTGIGSAAVGQLSLVANGSEAVNITDALMTLNVNIDSLANTIESSIGPVILGPGSEGGSHGLGVGDVIIGDNLEVTSITYANGGVRSRSGLFNDASYSFISDTDTGVSNLVSGTVSLVAIDFEALRITGTGGGGSATIDAYGDIQIQGTNRILIPSGSAAVPSIAWSADTDSGIWFDSPTFKFTVGGVDRVAIGTNGISGLDGNAFKLGNVTPSSTTPGMYPRSDANTGIGTASADQLSLIAGGIEGLRITEDSSSSSPILDAYGNLQVHGQSFSVLPATLTTTDGYEQIDWDDGNAQILDLESATGDVTLTLINPKAGASYVIEIRQDSAVARDIIWPSAVKWPGFVTPVISTGASAVDIVSLFFNGVAYLSSIGQDFG